MRTLTIAAAVLELLLTAAWTQTAPSNQPSHSGEVTIVVVDQNSVPILGARVRVEGPGGVILRCETDSAGHCHFALKGVPWALRVEKETYYIFTLPNIQTSGTLEVSLTRQEEVRETVNVVESSPAIDPAQVSSKEELSGLDIINIPYPNTRDYRYVLNFLPGVLLDQNAQPHVAGAETYQSLTLLDGFDVTQPANGQLLVRVSTDALRSVDAETSRLSARYGKEPAGILNLATGIGDDHFRFIATNFVPSAQNKKGWAFDKVDPRFTVSGPVKKGKVWFFDGIDGEYDNVIIPDLPSSQDSDTVWRVGNLAKVQANVTSSDIVAGSFLMNWLHDDHLGFSTLSPPATRPIDSENVYFASLNEQHVFSNEALLQVGFGFSRYGLRQTPIGNAPYVITPQQATGNYYLRAATTARRAQTIANLDVPKNWHGRHELISGVDIDRLSYDQAFARSPITSLRDCSTSGAQPCNSVALHSTFQGAAPSTLYNVENSAYFQDRWSPHERVLIEPGIRFDWDEIVRQPLFSPRLAGTYVFDNAGNTKFSAGIGVTYEATNLSLVALPFQGARSDTFYAADGTPTSFVTTFSVDRSRLLAPRFLNWSIALEQKLPAQIFLKTEFMRRTSIHGFAYDTFNSGSTNFLLQNTREDRYYAFRVDLRRTFRKRYTLTGSYIRSSSRSNQVLDYSLDNLILNPQVAGPYPWDVPNRFTSWGWFPLVKGFDTGYSLDMHTGFPFAAVSDQQQIVHPPGAYRFPMYFTLNLHLEKRFHALGFYWALRGGFDNITNRQNAFTVNNNLNSPQFLTFSNFDRRAFTARIRFLGRK